MKKMPVEREVIQGELMVDGKIFIHYIKSTPVCYCTVMYDDDGNVEIHPDSDGDVRVHTSMSGTMWGVNISHIIKELKIPGYDFYSLRYDVIKRLIVETDGNIIKFNVLK